MRLVHDADGNQHQAAASDPVLADVVFGESLFEFDFTGGAGAGNGVFQLQFGMESQPIVEVISAYSTKR
jgi:hypothetical protein